MNLASFEHVWLIDFEFCSRAGEPPIPICMVGLELHSGTLIRLWSDDLASQQSPFGPRDLVVAYYNAAEFGCFLALGWPTPANSLDLYVEFKNSTNGLNLPAGRGLLGACAYFGLPHIDLLEKDSMRALAMRGGPWAAHEKLDLLDYCETDVRALHQLLLKMEPLLDLDRALLRGRYMWSVALMERVGIPIDVPRLEAISAHWSEIRGAIRDELQRKYQTFEGDRFSEARFRDWLVTEGIEWPENDRGRLLLNDDVFKEQSLLHPELVALRKGRKTLAQLRPHDIPVGIDGRNRTMLSPFSSRTSRNQPKSSEFIFGAPSWFRQNIQPLPAHSLGYIDFEQQEFGIAGALSGDPDMLNAYNSGDPYLTFAKQAGAVPDNATKDTHPTQREQFKQCALGVIYGMGEHGLARRLGQPIEAARALLRHHRNAFPIFWEWSDAAIYDARLTNSIHTTFGWMQQVTGEISDRSLRNFPMQANGAEMLRFAIRFAQEQGVRVCAPVHDAILIEAPTESIADAIEHAREAMAEASELVLDGFRLRTDVERVDFPNHYKGKDPSNIWELVERVLNEHAGGSLAQQPLLTSAHPSSLLSLDREDTPHE